MRANGKAQCHELVQTLVAGLLPLLACCGLLSAFEASHVGNIAIYFSTATSLDVIPHRQESRRRSRKLLCQSREMQRPAQ